MAKRIGVLLSGCGFLDGAEIQESVLTLLHLDAAGAEVLCMAPRGRQMDVVNHATGEVAQGQERDVFEEAARIARGKLVDVAAVGAGDLDALVMPGGFGAAKNLSDFAVKGKDATPHAEVARLLREMHAVGKPIGAICISPAVVASALGSEGPKLTIGEDPGTAEALQAMGARHEKCAVTGFSVDEDNNILSTPAYMYDAKISDVARGIEQLVATLMERV